MSANQACTARFFDEVCNGRKLNVADQLFTTSHVHHDPANPRLSAGPAGIKELVSQYHQAFPDANWSVQEMLEAGNNVICRWTGKGTHQGNLSGIPPTGKAVTVTGIWILRFENGKIAESWDSWDALGLLQQIGVVPKLGQGAAGAD